jgi:hypothetical protein
VNGLKPFIIGALRWAGRLVIAPLQLERQGTNW